MDDVSCADIHEVSTNATCFFYHNTTDCHNDESYLDYLYFIFCYFQYTSKAGVALCAILLALKGIFNDYNEREKKGETSDSMKRLLFTMSHFCFNVLTGITDNWQILWLVLLFIGLGVTADDFLCPSLVVITKTLRLSQNIAGVTFLAFGNGAPDIFSSVAGIEQSRPELVIGTLFGAGIFVTSVVAGSIIVSKPFKIMERPFLRDIIFYICATFWAFLRFYFRELSLWHSIGFVVVYIMYIVVVIVSRIIYNRYQEKSKQEKENELSRKVSTIPTIEIMGPNENTSVTFQPSAADDDPEAEGVVLRRFSFRGSISGMRKRGSSAHSHHEHVIRALTSSVDDRQNPVFKNGVGHPPPLDSQISKTSLSSLLSSAAGLKDSMIKDFLYHTCPVDIDAWPERQWYYRIIDIVKAPVCFFLIITVPVVDYENDKNNWCRLLNVLHCMTSPMFIVLAVKEYNFMVGNVIPLWSVVLVLTFILAAVVFFTSSTQEPPCYHWAYGYLGFITSVVWVYIIASEIVSLLKAIGIYFSLSDAILGLTVLAWGNSIGGKRIHYDKKHDDHLQIASRFNSEIIGFLGFRRLRATDFISNLSVARQGYPRMGISACYGGPLLNLLLGIGIPYTVVIVKTGTSLKLSYTKLISLLYSTLCVILVSTIMTMTVLRFNARRWFGIYLLCVYGIFLALAVLLETNVIR